MALNNKANTGNLAGPPSPEEAQGTSSGQGSGVCVTGELL